MKYLWVIVLSLLCVACGGQFILTPNEHRALYKSNDGEFSCYTNNCCWPYKEKAMICIEASSDFGTFNSIIAKIKYSPDK